MGRWIDRMLLLSLVAIVLYLLFLQSFESITVSAGLSFACCAMLLRAQRQRIGHVRMTRYQAGAILEGWACEPDDDAREKIGNLLHRQGTMVYIGKHPSTMLGLSDVFSAWKSHRTEAHLILTTACYSDGRARTYAATLKNPSVEILDAAKLIPMIRRSNLPPPRIPAGRQLLQKMKEIFAALPGRHPWYKSLFSGLGLILLYLITGSLAYLILAMGLLLLSGISLRIRA